MLVSSYNYAAIVLVDSRFLYPTSYRAPSPAAPPGASLTPLAPPSPAAAPFSPAQRRQGDGSGGVTDSAWSWSTPKRNRDDEASRWGVVGERGAGGAGRISGPSRRRRKTPAARSGPFDSESSGEGGDAPAAKLVTGTASVRPSAQQEDKSAAASPVPLGRRDENTRNLRVSSAHHAVERGDGEMAADFSTPPAPKSGRKFLASSSHPSGVFHADGARSGAAKERQEGVCSVKCSAPLAREPVVIPAPVVGPSPSGTPRSSSPILLVSPPPLKAATAMLNSSSATPPSANPDAAATAGGGSSSNPRPAPSSPSQDSSYCGHYILLVGWSEADRVFIARDPALPSSSTPAAKAGTSVNGDGVGGHHHHTNDPSAHVCIALTPEALDRARRSYGTDEDVLVVDLARSRRGGVPARPLAAAAAATALAASAASSAAAASAMVGLLAMAAAAAAGAEVSGFKEWAWPDPAAWFAGQAADGEGGSGIANKIEVEETRGPARDGMAGQVVEGLQGMPRNGTAAESAAKRLASLLSLAASGLRFPTVGDAYRGPRVPWGNGAVSRGSGGGSGGGGNGGDGTDEQAEQERWAVRMASAMFMEGGRRAVYTLEGMLQGGRRAAYTMEGFLQGGALTMEGLLQGGAHTMEGLLQGGRRAAYTMEGLLEGGRRAAYNLRDQLADVADAPGGAGAECCSMAVLTTPGSPVTPGGLTAAAAVVSPA